MEFIDDNWDSQPRARRVHSRANADATTTSSSTNHASPSLPHAAACAAASVLLLAAVYYRLPAYQVLASILIWIASSLLLAPFAPSSATGGDVSVGRGRLLPDQEPPKESTPDPAPTSRRPRHQNPTPPPTKPSDPIIPPIQSPPPPPPRQPPLEAAASGTAVPDGGESEWTNQDMELLRRQMVKHPAGEPLRWEKIAAAGEHHLRGEVGRRRGRWGHVRAVPAQAQAARPEGRGGRRRWQCWRRGGWGQRLERRR